MTVQHPIAAGALLTTEHGEELPAVLLHTAGGEQRLTAEGIAMALYELTELRRTMRQLLTAGADPRGTRPH